MSKDILIGEHCIYVSSDDGTTWTRLEPPVRPENFDFRSGAITIFGNLKYVENAEDILAEYLTKLITQQKAEVIEILGQKKYDLEQAQQYKEAEEVKKLLDQIREMNEQEFEQWIVMQDTEGEG